VPERLGQIPIEVSALSGYAGDTVRRLLLVEVSKLLKCCDSDECSSSRIAVRRENWMEEKVFIVNVLLTA